MLFKPFFPQAKQYLKTKQFILGRSRSKKFKFQDLIFSVLIWNSGRGTLPCGAKQIIETNFSKTSTKPKMRCSWLRRKTTLRLYYPRLLSTISKFQACKMYNESFIELHNRYLQNTWCFSQSKHVISHINTFNCSNLFNKNYFGQ